MVNMGLTNLCKEGILFLLSRFLDHNVYLYCTDLKLKLQSHYKSSINVFFSNTEPLDARVASASRIYIEIIRNHCLIVGPSDQIQFQHTHSHNAAQIFSSKYNKRLGLLEAI